MPRRPIAPDETTPVAERWNLSDRTDGWRRGTGIATRGDLRRADLLGVWLELKVRHPQVTRVMYYAPWGALHNCHWREIPEAEKGALPV
jgi:hypothetical protein